MQLAYHHHDFELRPVAGRSGLDVILERVDPQLLQVEADVYWMHAAGLDPVAYLGELGDRVTLLHCKDAGPPGMQPVVEPEEGLAVFNTEVGEGVLDFPAILEPPRRPNGSSSSRTSVPATFRSAGVACTT